MREMGTEWSAHHSVVIGPSVPSGPPTTGDRPGDGYRVLHTPLGRDQSRWCGHLTKTAVN
jgi:hypothetical protein